MLVRSYLVVLTLYKVELLLACYPFESPWDNSICPLSRNPSFIFNMITTSVRRIMWVNVIFRDQCFATQDGPVCATHSGGRGSLYQITPAVNLSQQQLLSCQFNLHKIISSFKCKQHFLKSKSGGSPQIVLGMMWLLLREAPSEGLVKVVVFSTHNHRCNYYWI